jgi:formylglycine-generating enzyme required for sulfatase activity
MSPIPAGSFLMGDADGADDEKPAHSVRVDAFLMDRYEVTQEQYERLAGRENRSRFRDPRRPVERVSWGEAALFCNARSRAEGLTLCYDEDTGKCDFAADGYRLPTEAEWEYAARAGAADAHHSQSASRVLDYSVPRKLDSSIRQFRPS